ncbi:MAG: hypothetical protein WCS03_14250 [Bacteroidota bacterium]
MNDNSIKDRLATEVVNAKNRLSIVRILREHELSKTFPEGRSAYFKKRIFEIKMEMTKYQISDNWISNGCIDIMHKDGFWIEEVIKVNLKDKPEGEVWQEVQLFLKQYFLLIEYEKIVKESESEKKTETKKVDRLPKNENINLRRPVAFCICLLYKAGKYDISTMTKKRLEKYVGNNFKEVSAQKVVNTLLGYGLSNKKEQATFIYDSNINNSWWEFMEESFDTMIKSFPDDYNKALKMFEKFK